MTQDYLLWKNDITHRFSPTSLTDALTGSIYIATAIISGVTTNSAPKMTQWDAYFDLRNKLLKVSEFDGIAILPKATTTELSALTGIIDGQGVQNITKNRLETCLGSTWQSSAGAGMMSAAAYGSMFENNSAGSAMESTNKTWITATVGKVDANTIITFVNDDTNGDYLLVGTGGAGEYMVVASCGQTNAGNNLTTMSIHVNGVDITAIQDDQNSSSTNHRTLAANGIITLADGDKVTLHNVSSTPADVVKVYDCHVTINRLS